MLPYKALNQNSSQRGWTTDFFCVYLYTFASLKKELWKQPQCPPPFFLSFLPFGGRIPSGTLGRGSLSFHINIQHHCLWVSLLWNHLCFLKMLLTSKCHLIIDALSPSMFSQTFYTKKKKKTTEEKWIKLRIKVKERKITMGFVAAVGEQLVRSALQRHIPKPVIINGLTSTGKKREKKDRVWKLRTKEIPADKVKTN